MIAKSRSNNSTAYYWSPHNRDFAAGSLLRREALGTDYAAAIAKAELLNEQLDAWRQERHAPKSYVTSSLGSLNWLVKEYKLSRAWDKVSARSRPDYERGFSLVLSHSTRTGSEVGKLAVSSVSARAVDKLYVILQKGKQVEKRLRTVNLAMAFMARAWDVVHRLYPQIVPAENPFRGIQKEKGRRVTRPATREEAYGLHRALIAQGELHLAAVPLICFEWHQRPENVLAGHIAWTDFRPPERPESVRIQHHKTGELVSLPLSDSEGQLFPELTAYLDGLERLGVPIVLLKPKGKTCRPARPFKLRYARARIRKAANKAKLPVDLTLAACRHGGLTELGNAELTEQGVMALSGHKTPDAARPYVKRTDIQRSAAARKRRAWIESNIFSERVDDKSQNDQASPKSE